MSEAIHSISDDVAREEMVQYLRQYPASMLSEALDAVKNNPSLSCDEFTNKELYKIKARRALEAKKPDYWVEDETRFSLLPIKHRAVWDMYVDQKACFWTAGDVSFEKDDYASLPAGIKKIMKYIMGFFNVADGIVNENIFANLLKSMPAPEAKCMYIFQMAQENKHAEVYGRMIDEYITDPEEKRMMFEAASNMRAVKIKVDWDKNWLTETSGVAQSLAAFAVVECMSFPVIFAIIWWMMSEKYPMEGFFLANEFISRDEGKHGDAGCLIYREYISDETKLSEKDIKEMVRGAVESDEEFIAEALGGCFFPGLDTDKLKQYSRFLGDQTLNMLGYTKMFFAVNPFKFMKSLGIAGRTDFFSRRVSEYRKDSPSGHDSANALLFIDGDL